VRAAPVFAASPNGHQGWRVPKLIRRHGRTEDEAALRDAWYLRRAGDDPGPAGRLLQAWRRLAERGPLDQAIRLALPPKDWMGDLTVALDLHVDAALEEVGEAAKTLAAGEASPIAAAAEVAAVSLQKRPDAAVLALWLADAVLAHHLRWPGPVPLIAGQIRRSDLRAAVRPDRDDAWQISWTLAYARAAAAAADLYAELARRAHHLLAAARKLRGRDAARRVEILLTEDAQAATAGASAVRQIELEVDRLRQAIEQHLDVGAVHGGLALRNLDVGAEDAALLTIVWAFLRPVDFLELRIDGDADAPAILITRMLVAAAGLDQRFDLRAVEIGAHHAHALAIAPVELAARLIEVKLFRRLGAAWRDDDLAIPSIEVDSLDRTVVERGNPMLVQ
jgi:hypothetical protein